MSMNKYVCHVNSTCREFVNSWPSWQFWHVYRPSSMGKKTRPEQVRIYSKFLFWNNGKLKSRRWNIRWLDKNLIERVIFFNERRLLSPILILHTTWHIISHILISTDFSLKILCWLQFGPITTTIIGLVNSNTFNNGIGNPGQKSTSLRSFDQCLFGTQVLTTWWVSTVVSNNRGE